MTGNRYIRGALGVVAGMLFITVAVEALEWTLVTAIHRAPTTDPETYYGIRNGRVFLLVKLLYNTAGAMGGGYLAARIAGGAERGVGVALALIQAGALVAAMFNPDLSRFAPSLLFPTLAVVSFAGVIAGAHLAARRRLGAGPSISEG